MTLKSRPQTGRANWYGFFSIVNESPCLVKTKQVILRPITAATTIIAYYCCTPTAAVLRETNPAFQDFQQLLQLQTAKCLAAFFDALLFGQDTLSCNRVVRTRGQEECVLVEAGSSLKEVVNFLNLLTAQLTAITSFNESSEVS